MNKLDVNNMEFDLQEARRHLEENSFYLNRNQFAAQLKSLRRIGKMGREIARKVYNKTKFTLDFAKDSLDRKDKSTYGRYQDFCKTFGEDVGGFPTTFGNLLDWYMSHPEDAKRKIELLKKYKLAVNKEERQAVVRELQEFFDFNPNMLVKDVENK